MRRSSTLYVVESKYGNAKQILKMSIINERVCKKINMPLIHKYTYAKLYINCIFQIFCDFFYSKKIYLPNVLDKNSLYKHTKYY